MNENERLNELTRVLEDTSNELDVPASKYEEAKDRYKTVGEFIGNEAPLADYDPLVYAQGSFGLGTAIRPINDGDYDVDSVLLLRSPPNGLTPKELKDLVGKRLLESDRYRKMLDPKSGGRRCWTIKYADESRFYLDVLPAIPDLEATRFYQAAIDIDSEWLKDAIRITDNTTPEYETGWPSVTSLVNDPTRSNPLGYGKFFRKQMEVQLDLQKSILATNKRAEISEIEDFDVRTPLQRLVQLLKRHRDVNYGTDDDRPISIIITTLAARAYRNEPDLGDAMLNVVPRMRDWIENRDGVWWVVNPVNPLENFADKWEETPRKAAVFFRWLSQVELEHKSLLTTDGFAKIGSVITKAYGVTPGMEVMEKFANRMYGISTSATLLVPQRTTPRSPSVVAPVVKPKPWKS
jgi:hypothetical protein